MAVVHTVSPERLAEIEAERKQSQARQDELIEKSREYFRSVGRYDIVEEIDHPEPSLASRIMDFVDGVLDFAGMILRAVFYGLMCVLVIKFIMGLFG